MMKKVIFLILVLCSFSVFAKQTTEEDVNKAYKSFMENAKSESMKKDLTRVYNCYSKFKGTNILEVFAHYGVHIGFDESSPDIDQVIEFYKSLKKVHKKYGDNNCILIIRDNADITNKFNAKLLLRMVFDGHTLDTANDRIAHLDEMIEDYRRSKEIEENNQRKIDSL